MEDIQPMHFPWTRAPDNNSANTLVRPHTASAARILHRNLSPPSRSSLVDDAFVLLNGRAEQAHGQASSAREPYHSQQPAEAEARHDAPGCVEQH